MPPKSPAPRVLLYGAIFFTIISFTLIFLNANNLLSLSSPITASEISRQHDAVTTKVFLDIEYTPKGEDGTVRKKARVVLGLFGNALPKTSVGISALLVLLFAWVWSQQLASS
ncbi:hypothetical protein HDU76_013166 [Blyttiomyces sp. JEL0837]|nr:hypothetical protein HDU76_013166 [Blyttiomyces sp. JEL0837]